MPSTCDGAGRPGIGQPPPESLAPLFQEYDLQRLDDERDASLIIERTLEGGSQTEVQWLFERYGEDCVREVVRDRGARHLSARAFNFWRLVLDMDDWRPHPWPELAGALWGGRG